MAAILMEVNNILTNEFWKQIKKLSTLSFLFFLKKKKKKGEGVEGMLLSMLSILIDLPVLEKIINPFPHSFYQVGFCIRNFNVFIL